MHDGDSNTAAGSLPLTPSVEAALARVDELDHSDLQGTVEIYEQIHNSLSAALEGDADIQPAPAER